MGIMYEQGPRGYLPKWLRGTLDLVLEDQEYAEELGTMVTDQRRSWQLSSDEVGGIEEVLRWRKRRQFLDQHFGPNSNFDKIRRLFQG